MGVKKSSLLTFVTSTAIVVLICIFITSMTEDQVIPDAADYGPISAQSEKTFGSVTITRIVSIHDGDTFNVDINDWPPIAGKNIGVRIYGIDTPEIHSDNEKLKQFAVVAKSKLDDILSSAHKVELRNLRRDKYFRINADVYADGVDVASKMIDLKVAKPYDGGKKQVWTVSDYNLYLKGKSK